jgi:hypothetical protein
LDLRQKALMGKWLCPAAIRFHKFPLIFEIPSMGSRVSLFLYYVYLYSLFMQMTMVKPCRPAAWYAYWSLSCICPHYLVGFL